MAADGDYVGALPPDRAPDAGTPSPPASSWRTLNAAIWTCRSCAWSDWLRWNRQRKPKCDVVLLGRDQGIPGTIIDPEFVARRHRRLGRQWNHLGVPIRYPVAVGRSIALSRPVGLPMHQPQLSASATPTKPRTSPKAAPTPAHNVLRSGWRACAWRCQAAWDWSLRLARTARLGATLISCARRIRSYGLPDPAPAGRSRECFPRTGTTSRSAASAG